METRRSRVTAFRDAALVAAFVLFLRVPFLDQAIQGDDVNYLAAAQNAQVNPLHPLRFWFVFMGDRVTMRGHTHPPFNAWFLGGLLALFGGIEEVRFHAAYILFSLIAAFSALSLARRFTAHPLIATILLLSIPAFVVNGTSLESDVPLFAFWLAVTALFVKAVDKASLGWLAASMVAMPFAAMTAFQSVLLVPVLGVYLWRERRTWRPAWAALLVIPLVFGGWQLWERSGSEQIPAGTLVAYFRKYGWQSLANKGKNAVTLTAHLGLLGLAAFLRPSFPQAAWIGGIAVVTGLALDPHPLFVIPFAGGVMVVAWCIRHRDDFLAQWTLLFFAAALVIFFAGSARYLLPLAAPVVFLSVRLLSARPKILWGAAAANLSVSLALASVNYQQWNACKEFVKAAGIEDQTARVWVNSEHGLRFYAESAGAVPLERGQSIRPGEFLLANRLASRVPFTTGGSALVPLREMVVTSAIPLRIVGAGAKSGYSTSEMGFRVFDWNSGPIDVIRLDRAVERKPVLSYLPMNAAEAASQIVSGVENLEENRYRWMGKRAVLLLKRPPAATPIEIEFFLHEKATAKNMIVSLDGKQIANEPLTQGARTIRMGPYMPAGETATLIIEVDNTFSVPGDQRVLGAILIGAGFR